MATTADEYYTLAKAFCTYVEKTVITKGELDAIMTHLMTLYMKGMIYQTSNQMMLMPAEDNEIQA